MVTLVVLDWLLESTTVGAALGLPPLARVILTSVSCPIGFGALLAMAAHHPRFGRRIVAFAAQRLMVPVVGLATLSLVLVPWAPVVVLHGCLALLVLVCTARKRHVLSAVFEHPIVAYVGRVSYGIYLWHVAVLGGIKALFPSLAQQSLALFLLGLPLSVAVAAVSYAVFEKPWLRIAQRYKRRLPVESRHAVAITAVLDG
jgi:peptidoglycan/LPS O-acetylase OafA/YrhL